DCGGPRRSDYPRRGPQRSGCDPHRVTPRRSMTRSLRIAVADDDADMRDFLRQALPALGHEVVCVAASGQQLVEECRTVRPDLILTDIKMPDVDGIDAAEQICRERPVPIILV